MVTTDAVGQPIYTAPNTDPDDDGPLDAQSPQADEAHPAKLVVNQDSCQSRYSGASNRCSWFGWWTCNPTIGKRSCSIR